MLEGVLKQIRENIRTRRYGMTLHAEEEMEDDGLTIFDVEHAILSGAIVEKQRDHDTGESKYRDARAFWSHAYGGRE